MAVVVWMKRTTRDGNAAIKSFFTRADTTSMSASKSDYYRGVVKVSNEVLQANAVEKYHKPIYEAAKRGCKHVTVIGGTLHDKKALEEEGFTVEVKAGRLAILPSSGSDAARSIRLKVKNYQSSMEYAVAALFIFLAVCAHKAAHIFLVLREEQRRTMEVKAAVALAATLLQAFVETAAPAASAETKGEDARTPSASTNTDGSSESKEKVA